MKNMVERYMNILKPSQQIAFLTWIEDNQACMYMLNSIWMNKNTNTAGNTSGSATGSATGSASGNETKTIANLPQSK